MVIATAVLFCGRGMAGALVAPPPETLRAYDRPSDDGSVVAVEWGRSPSEGQGVYYVVEIAPDVEGKPGQFKRALTVPSTTALKSDQPKFFGFSKKNREVHYVGIEPARYFPPDPAKVRAQVRAEESKRLKPEQLTDPNVQAYLGEKAERRLKREIRRVNGLRYHFRVAIRSGGQLVYIARDGRPAVVSAAARPNLFKRYKLNNLTFSVLFCGVVLGFIRLARRNPNLFIRKIAGLEAVEEAIGRATEMGRTVFFVHGLGGVGGLATLAALNILARICRRAAEYDTRVRVMNNEPIVLAVSQEVVKEAYTEAGRPDAYDPDDVSLVASDQFSYAAAVGGRMVRERPGAIFLMGSFAAESLLLAETGASTGAIQIAGTDSYTQLPFFVTTCDYTLIGEELYAASAYLSREPRMLGSLRGQDVGKAFLMLTLVAGVVLLTVAKAFGWDFAWVSEVFRPF